MTCALRPGEKVMIDLTLDTLGNLAECITIINMILYAGCLHG